MQFIDDVIDLSPFGVALLCVEGAPRDGMRIRDARGNIHFVSSVTESDGIYTLHIPDGSADYFGRLFRNVLLDATHFEEVD